MRMTATRVTKINNVVLGDKFVVSIQLRTNRDYRVYRPINIRQVTMSSLDATKSTGTIAFSWLGKFEGNKNLVRGRKEMSF